jgi:hypothetical protein
MPHRALRLLTLVLAWPLTTIGCGDLRNSSHPSEQARFELKNDNNGRLVRLDKTTGEIRVVDDPATHTPPAAGRRTREKRKPVVASTSENAALVTSTTCVTEHVRTVTVSVAKAPVFILPKVLPTPLVTLPSDTELPVVESTGSWYRVQFEDSTLGPRIGYIHCGSVAAPEHPSNRRSQ